MQVVPLDSGVPQLRLPGGDSHAEPLGLGPARGSGRAWPPWSCRDDNSTAKVADACVIISTVNADHVTPHTEAFQTVVWQLFVSNTRLKAAATRWESVR